MAWLSPLPFHSRSIWRRKKAKSLYSSSFSVTRVLEVNLVALWWDSEGFILNELAVTVTGAPGLQFCGCPTVWLLNDDGKSSYIPLTLDFSYSAVTYMQRAYGNSFTSSPLALQWFLFVIIVITIIIILKILTVVSVLHTTLIKQIINNFF